MQWLSTKTQDLTSAKGIMHQAPNKIEIPKHTKKRKKMGGKVKLDHKGLRCNMMEVELLSRKHFRICP